MGAKETVRAGKFVEVAMPEHSELYQARMIKKDRLRRRLLLPLQPSLALSPECLSLIQSVIESLPDSWDVMVRPHPAHLTNVKQVVRELRLFIKEHGLRHRVMMESPRKTGLVESLKRTDVVIGTFGAVMLEGWLAGCKIIHMPYLVHPSTVMERYDSSPNVVYIDSATTPDRIREFVCTAPVLEGAEDERVRYLFSTNLIKISARSRVYEG